jgi:S1-C subfamily serine protease
VGQVSIHLPALPGTVQTFASVINEHDPAHDLAVLRGASGSSSRGLSSEATPEYVGERLVLLGFPGGAASEPDALHGTVIGTDQFVKLTSPDGLDERLDDAIAVAVSGAVEGDSGGPAIDADGKVVGVIEGIRRGVAFLTPIADVPSGRLG